MSSDDKHPLNAIRDRCLPRDRKNFDRMFRLFCIATASFSVLILAVLLISILWQGWSTLSWHLLTNFAGPDHETAGFGPALWGTIWLCITCGILALPIGVATAVLLEEFPPTNKWLRMLHTFVQLNINNLAGVPSVVYGLLGLTVFVGMFGVMGTASEPKFEFGVRHFDQFFSAGKRALLVPVETGMPPTIATEGMKAMTSGGEWVDVTVVNSRRALPQDDAGKAYALIAGKEAGRISRPSWYYFRLPLDRSILAGALTLMLVILPVVIISSQEAIRGVPSSLREAGLGLGATRWQVVRNVTLPASIPGIMTGAILSMSRAIGEAAPILIIAGVVFITSNPGNLLDSFTVMPLQIYNWTGRPQHEFHKLAASGILVLLVILFIFNSAAVLIRQFASKQLS